MNRMHDGQVDIELRVVAAMIAEQLPQYAALPLAEVPSGGTVNRIIRVGDDLVARLPLMPDWADSLDRETRWLPELAPHLPLRVPRPVARGRATDAFPHPWVVVEWIEGDTYPIGERLGPAAEVAAARGLAAFVLALRAIPIPADAPTAGRRPLAELDAGTRRDLRASADRIDAAAAEAVWARALLAPAWHGPPAWIHSDLLPGNVLVDANRRIAAVIDFGGVGVGDPAHDLIPAWTLFDRPGRDAFRAALAPTAGEWDRARGIALHQAAAIIPYYRQTNPGFVGVAVSTVGRVLDDAG